MGKERRKGMRPNMRKMAYRRHILAKLHQPKSQAARRNLFRGAKMARKMGASVRETRLWGEQVSSFYMRLPPTVKLAKPLQVRLSDHELPDGHSFRGAQVLVDGNESTAELHELVANALNGRF